MSLDMVDSDINEANIKKKLSCSAQTLIEKATYFKLQYSQDSGAKREKKNRRKRKREKNKIFNILDRHCMLSPILGLTIQAHLQMNL